MARARDYRAEYRARIERARAQGLSIAQATGHARRAGVPSITELRRQGTIPARPSRRPKPTTDITTPAGRLARTGNQQVVRDLIRQAATSGQKVTVRARFQLDDRAEYNDGQGTGEWRTATLDGDGGERELLGQALRFGADVPRESSSGRRPGALTTSGRPGVEIGITSDYGMDAVELLAFTNMYASVWDALYALFIASRYL